MQTGRLVTCILKIAGQREHRLPDQKQQQKNREIARKNREGLHFFLRRSKSGKKYNSFAAVP